LRTFLCAIAAAGAAAYLDPAHGLPSEEHVRRAAAQSAKSRSELILPRLVPLDIKRGIGQAPQAVSDKPKCHNNQHNASAAPGKITKGSARILGLATADYQNCNDAVEQSSRSKA
jgi:hypothetical protein